MTSAKSPAFAVWRRLAGFHENPIVIQLWLQLFRPVLRWLTPPRRRRLLALAALLIAVRLPLHSLYRTADDARFAPTVFGLVLLVLTVFSFVALCYLAAQRFATWPRWVQRHPQISLHALFWALALTLWLTQPQNAFVLTLLIGWLCVLPFILWRVGYMMFSAQRGRMKGTTLADHLFYVFPLWGGTDTPYGKGHDYLTANEAMDEEALARSQLAGVKLFILAGLWALVAEGMRRHVFGETASAVSLDAPRLGEMFANPSAYPLWLRWLSLYLELVWAVLNLAIKGHLIIGWLRLFGFNVFRNTYKPLLAESIVEFWNRYYYYFKELLVNFFFFPIFARHFKNSPRLRVFTAVFAAAFFGNIYYHWLQLDRELATANFTGMWATLQSRIFYCLLLALGIYISMQREQKRTRAGAPPRRMAPFAILGVWTFFSIIHIWSEKDPASFWERANFFLGLLGLRLTT